LDTKNKAKVSILIPVYNRTKIILETLHSAIRQTYENLEVIVVDNKSTDGTFEIVKKFAQTHLNVKVYQNAKNIGPVKNWRKCLDYATGEYAKILWSDDLIAPEFIEKTLPSLTNNHDVGFVFTGTEIFYETGQKKDAYFIGETGIYPMKNYLSGVLIGANSPVSPGCALFRLKDLKKNLLLNIPNKLYSDFSMHAIGNDLLIYLLTAKDYLNFAFINEKLAFFRAHKDSITVNSKGGKRVLLYDIVKAYFVENYLNDKALEKKFNVLLLLHFLKYGKNSLKLKKMSEFYFKKKVKFFDIDIWFFLKIVFTALLKFV